MNLLYRWANFMRGRRGWDQFNFFLLIASFVIEILGRIFGQRYIYLFGVALFFYSVYRALSRNIAAREAENQKYLQITNRIKNWRYFRQQKKQGTYTYTQSEQNRNGAYGSTVYAYYYCPCRRGFSPVVCRKGNSSRRILYCRRRRFCVVRSGCRCRCPAFS
ncbi:MAG: hypothetical protein IJ132_03025, partial [Firmicutes bacterium]|nr:hypothetical protein [Bacillota bacterium]